MSVKKWNATKQEAENIVGSQIEAKEIYSTSEVKTNKVWIDGKPIYRRVVAGTTPSASGSVTNIDWLGNVDKIVFREGHIYETNYGWTFQINSYQSEQFFVFLNINASIKTFYWIFGLNTFYNNMPYELIIEYTKK